MAFNVYIIAQPYAKINKELTISNFVNIFRAIPLYIMKSAAFNFSKTIKLSKFLTLKNPIR